MPRNIDLIFRSPGAESLSKLGIDIRRDVYLIFNEAVNNALRHSDCGLLEVTIAQENGVFALTIRDDGRGFDPAGDGCGNGLHEHAATSASARRQARDRVARGRWHDHRAAVASHGHRHAYLFLKGEQP